MAKLDNLGAYAESLATQLGAFNVKKYLTSEALRVSRYANFTLHRFLGNYVGGEGMGSTPNFERLQQVADEFRVPYQLTLPTYLTGVARGIAAHTAAWTASTGGADNHGGAGYCKVAEYVGRASRGTDEMTFLDGANSAVNMEKFWRSLIIDSCENTLGTALWATAAPSASVLGGIPYAIDDGVTSDVYLGVSRADALNADLRAYVDSTAEPFSVEKFDLACNTISTRTIEGGGPALADTAITGLTIFGRCQSIARSFSQGNMNSDIGKVGFKHVELSGVMIGLDQRVPAGQFYVGDSRAWTVATNAKRGYVTLLDWGIDQTTIASFMFAFQNVIQVACKAPYTWYKFTNKT
jgi:hypothetical protein